MRNIELTDHDRYIYEHEIRPYVIEQIFFIVMPTDYSSIQETPGE